MEDSTLDKYLRDLKFIVIADASNGKPIGIHFGFKLPNIHYEIFLDAQKKFDSRGMYLRVQGGGRITKRGNKIIFHSQSEKYGRYEDEIVLRFAPEHEMFVGKELEFYSKAGENDINRIIQSTSPK